MTIRVILNLSRLGKPAKERAWRSSVSQVRWYKFSQHNRLAISNVANGNSSSLVALIPSTVFRRSFNAKNFNNFDTNHH